MSMLLANPCSYWQQTVHQRQRKDLTDRHQTGIKTLIQITSNDPIIDSLSHYHKASATLTPITPHLHPSYNMSCYRDHITHASHLANISFPYINDAFPQNHIPEKDDEYLYQAEISRQGTKVCTGWLIWKIGHHVLGCMCRYLLNMASDKSDLLQPVMEASVVNNLPIYWQNNSNWYSQIGSQGWSRTIQIFYEKI